MNVLQVHHEQYQHHLQLQFELHYTEMAKGSNSREHAMQDVHHLVERSLSKNHITAYRWVVAFSKALGLHAHLLCYLDSNQHHEALTVIAVESGWSHFTGNEGHVVEVDVNENGVDYFAEVASLSPLNSSVHIAGR